MRITLRITSTIRRLFINNLLSPLPQKRSYLIRILINLFLWYPIQILLVASVKDKKQREEAFQNLIEKLNKLNLDPYLGIVRLLQDGGVIYDGVAFHGLSKGGTSCIKEVFFDEYLSKPNPGDVVIDVGANIGVYSIFASKFAEKVIAIEPETVNYNYLTKNIKLKSNIYPFKIALGDIEGKCKLYLHTSMAHSIVFTSDKFEEVSVTKLDDLKEKLNLERVDVIKINAEGYELQILKGAETVIKTCTPRLLIGIHHYDSEREEVIDYLNSLESEGCQVPDSF